MTGCISVITAILAALTKFKITDATSAKLYFLWIYGSFLGYAVIALIVNTSLSYWSREEKRRKEAMLLARMQVQPKPISRYQVALAVLTWFATHIVPGLIVCSLLAALLVLAALVSIRAGKAVYHMNSICSG